MRPVRTILSALFIASSLVVAASPVSASATTTTDFATFQTATGAIKVIDMTNSLSCSPPSSYLENGYEIGDLFGFGVCTRDWTANHPDLELAVNGPETLVILTPLPVYAFGLYLEDDTSAVGANCPGADSSFDISFYLGATLVYQTTHDPANDVLSFFGVSSNEAFDRIEFHEVGATPTGPGNTNTCEDDFFGDMYASTAAGAPVPELPPAALAGVGLAIVAAVALVARRN